MSLKRNPATIRASKLREDIKVKFLSGHLRKFPSEEKTLDIGCGWGFSLQINPNFWLVDADEAAISYLTERGANAYLCDIAKPLPFEDGFFDNAFTHDVLEHLEEEEMLLLFKDARRILRKGGLFMNVVPNYKGFLRPDIGHKRYVTSAEVADAARESGFELVDSYYSPLPKALSELWINNKLVTICRAV